MRPVLVGMNQPLEGLEALDPSVPGSTGHRIWRMLHDHSGASQEEYMRAFARRNVLDARDWCATEARVGAGRLPSDLAGRRVVVLGSAPLQALGLPRPPGYGEFVAWGGPPALEYCHVPHPSGRCREYNDPGLRVAVGRLLARLYSEALLPEAVQIS